MFVPRLVNEENGVLGLGKGCHDLRTGQRLNAQTYTLGSDLLTEYVVPLLWLEVDVKTTNVRLLHIGAHVRPLCVRRQVRSQDKQQVVPPILDLIMIVPRQLF